MFVLIGLFTFSSALGSIGVIVVLLIGFFTYRALMEGAATPSQVWANMQAHYQGQITNNQGSSSASTVPVANGVYTYAGRATRPASCPYPRGWEGAYCV